jgi:hypothetical protein
MKASEIIIEIRKNKVDEKNFIKWWRKENDFVDYELVETFISTTNPNQEFAGYEILDLQGMWETLQSATPQRVTREKRGHKEVIVWRHLADDGTEKTEVCSFSPLNVMSIFDAETRGDVVDS